MEQEGRNMRLIDADALPKYTGYALSAVEVAKAVENAPTIDASRWHRVEDGLPKKAGEYIVAYHPCWWNDVKTSVTEIGIDTFRGKTSWAKRKFQRVTHWTEKPDPPKEDA
jgi:hypothetical protein